MSTRAKYFRVKPQEDKTEAKLDTDILMRFSQSYGKYISRALTLFFGEDKSFVTIKAAERLADRALWVSQIVRRKVPNLHQIITISEKKIVDIFVPKEQGLLKVEKERYLTIIEVTLTREPTAEQKKAPGYQPPLKGEESEFLTKTKWQEQEKERAEKRNNSSGRPPRRQNRTNDRGAEQTRGRRPRGS